ncbi:hypothetical protein K2173_012175 [Erythroxylum novogranatense]|uniref:ABC transporter B family member 29, chloroplastic n=1 Tax=Erythroxylum novogranatense TaxID=1862640 RepID=A0AAV8SS15_9ROSI|nr:hypothetical protein K2173_012175 [Erythroxylum novogranatense]
MAKMSQQLLLKTSIFPLPSPKLKPKPQNALDPSFPSPTTKSRILFLPSKPLLKPLLATKLGSPPPSTYQSPKRRHNPFSSALQTLSTIKPHLLSQLRPILLGWFFSLVTVVSLSQIVPRIGKLSGTVSGINSLELRNEGLVVGVLFLTKLIACYWQQAFLWEAALNSVYGIRIHVFECVLDREMSFFEGGSGVSAGDIAYRITAEAADVANTVYALLSTIVPSVLQLSAMASQMMANSPVLSLISAMVIPCVAVAIAHLGERLRSISKRAHLSIATLSAYLNEVLPGILFVKANNAEQCESARFKRLAYVDLTEHLKKKKLKAFIPQIVQIVYFGSLFTLCIGSLVVSRGCFNGCSLVSFITSLVFLIEPLQDIGKAVNEWKQGEPAIERLFDMTRIKSKVIEKPDAVNLDYVKGDIQFCDISFRYGDNRPLVLNRLNLHIKAGETVAFVGPSGGGKTTIVKLLLRLYDPLSGCVLVDNQNIQNIKLESLRKNIGLVSQDITLFSGTVAENIGYRELVTRVDMEKVELASQIAYADEFIRKLPKGYNTNIGPRGSSLSGGQKQRLAIARALYQDSSILILDEATSALDSKSELFVRQALQNLKGNHTVIVISHRLETILMAERVFLLENGKAEELTRSTLLAAHYNSQPLHGIAV